MTEFEFNQSIDQTIAKRLKELHDDLRELQAIHNALNKAMGCQAGFNSGEAIEQALTALSKSIALLSN